MIPACCKLLRKISLAFSYGILPDFHDIPWQFLRNQKFIRIYFINKLLHGHGSWKSNVTGSSEEALMDSIASSFNTKSFSGFLKPWRSTTKSIDFYFQKSRTLAHDRINSTILMIEWGFKKNRLQLYQLPHHSLEYSMPTATIDAWTRRYPPSSEKPATFDGVQRISIPRIIFIRELLGILLTPTPLQPEKLPEHSRTPSPHTPSRENPPAHLRTPRPLYTEPPLLDYWWRTRGIQA